MVDFDKFSTAYENTLGLLFDRQFGIMCCTQENEFQQGLSYIQGIFRAMIERAQNEFNKTPAAAATNNFANILCKRPCYWKTVYVCNGEYYDPV